MEDSHLTDHQRNPHQVAADTTKIIEREIIIRNNQIHIKSIFNGHTSLDEALKKIVLRKLSDSAQ